MPADLWRYVFLFFNFWRFPLHLPFILKNMMIKILLTGGTFDKEYDEIEGKLYFNQTHLPEILELGRCKLKVSMQTLMLKDSLEMTDADRQLILNHCKDGVENKIIITH